MRIIILFFLVLPLCSLSAQSQISLAQSSISLRESISDFEKLKRTGNQAEIAKSAANIAQIYAENTFSTKAIEYYYLASQNLNNQSNIEFKIGLIKGLADSYLLENQPDSVLHYQHILLTHYENENDVENQILTLQNIAHIQEQQEKFSAAIDSYNRIKNHARNNPNERILALNNIGCLYNKQQKFTEAIEVFSQAEQTDTSFIALNKTTLYCNLGIAHTNAQNIPEALRYFALAEKTTQSNQQKAQVAHLTANVHLQKKDWYNTQEYNKIAMKNAQQEGEAELLGKTYATAATVHQALFEYEEALTYYQKYLNIRDSLLLEERVKQQALLQNQIMLEKSEKEIRFLIANEEINDLTINRLELEKNNLKLASDKYALEAAQQEASISLLQKEKDIKESELRNQELAALQARQQLRLTKQQLEAEQKDRNIADLQQKEEMQEMKLAEQSAIEKERLQQIELLSQEQAISSLKIEQQATFRQGAYIAGGLMLLILGLMAASYWFARRANRRLAAQKLEIEKSQKETEAEKAKSDALLLNILPAATALELKETGVATPRHYEQVSVLFTDFVNFTQMAEKVSAEALIEELNVCFFAFDEIIESHGLEKIKTIGDAYMCAGGIPKANKTNALDTVKAGLAMQEFMNNRCRENREKGLISCEMRLGIHTGPVVAGVVGKNKFAYDIWGDTVNLASRMESASEAGKVNVSQETLDLLGDTFDTTPRGAIEIKNKGKEEMYFVKRKN